MDLFSCALTAEKKIQIDGREQEIKVKEKKNE